MPALSELGFFFGFEPDGLMHDPFDVWSDEYLAEAYPDDLTNLVVLARIGANAAATAAVEGPAPLTQAPHGPITSEPAMPPAERNIAVAIPYTHPATPAVNADNGQAGIETVDSGPAPYGPWRNYPDFPRSVIVGMSEELRQIQEQHIASNGHDHRNELAYNKGINLLYHLLPGEMLVIARGVPYSATYSIQTLREKVSRAGRHMGATLRLVTHEDRFEIGRLN